MLLVLDNCEHVIATAAGLASGVLRGSHGVRILATSLEPLRVEGERVHRLASLSSTVTPVGLTTADALGFPAVQLFVERAAASSGVFELGARPDCRRNLPTAGWVSARDRVRRSLRGCLWGLGPRSAAR